VTSATGIGHTLGVAVEIPPPFGPQLDAARERFAPDAGEMPAHVTILAPVDVDADVLDAVLEHLAAVAERTRPFRLVLQGSGTFRPVSPVVFVAVAQGISACEQLERDVRSGDLAVESRFPYHPHVTIAHDIDDAGLDEAFEELTGFRASMEIGSMGLHEHVDGRWSLVREFPFGG
jgi:2'-5' RNA ligase